MSDEPLRGSHPENIIQDVSVEDLIQMNKNLESENKRLREALERIVKDWGCDYMDCQECGGTVIARKALEEGK